MEINKIANLSAIKSAASGNQPYCEAKTEQPQQTEFVSSPASQASRAYASANIRNLKNINFEGKYEKLTQSIKEATSPSKVHLTFDEVSNLLERLGYKVEAGKGSHCTVDIPNSRPLTVVRPHGGHKYVDPETIKDLKILLEKEDKKLLHPNN